jgi:hypothetical protein
MMRGFIVEFRSMQQSLRGNAADIEAGSTVRGALLHNRNLHPKLGGANGADITARAGADHNQIEHAVEIPRFKFEAERL